MEPLGAQELDVLKYVAERAPLSVRAVAEGYGEERGLARTTVQTVMERLRKKGYLIRKRRAGVFRYTPRTPHSEVLQSLVRQFVETTLNGSVSPFVAYLAHSRALSADELAALQRLVRDLEEEAREETP